jgi:hypothetical protein
MLQYYNFACGSVWAWNLVSYIKGVTYTECVWEQSAEKNTWIEKWWSDGRVEKTAQRGAAWFVLFVKCN